MGRLDGTYLVTHRNQKASTNWTRDLYTTHVADEWLSCLKLRYVWWIKLCCSTCHVYLAMFGLCLGYVWLCLGCVRDVFGHVCADGEENFVVCVDPLHVDRPALEEILVIK